MGQVEDGVSLAFLDLRPLFPGHLLLAPRATTRPSLTLPDELVALLFANAWLLARAAEKGLAAHGSFVAVDNRVNQSVPHLHIHVVLRRKKDDLRGFFWPRQRYSDREAILAVQEILRDAVAQLLAEAGTTGSPGEKSR